MYVHICTHMRAYISFGIDLITDLLFFSRNVNDKLLVLITLHNSRVLSLFY